MEGGLEKDAHPMSARELKARLYQTFTERGMVESLKSQLRTKLVAELRQNAALQHVKFTPSPSASSLAPQDGSSSLMLRATNSLVVDHMRRCSYDYSMAVFLPESGSAEDKMFTIPDLLSLLRIPPGSKLYNKLASDLPRYDSKGFLWQLLSELTAGRSMGQEDVGVQVDAHSHQSSIERKLQSVDDVYKQRSDEDDMLNRHSIQEKLLKMKREMELKSREETTREISRFKESELKRVEMEEREKARKEIASARKEIERTYQAKSDALREREQATMDRLSKHQELIERETYAQRQSLLEELRVIKQRETDIRRESEVNSRAAKMEEDKRKAVEENLRIREAAVANIELTYEKRLKEETKRFELDHEARVAKRLNEIEQRESKVRADQRSMTEERQTMKSLQQQLTGKARHIQELEDLLKEAKSEMASAVNRNELVNEKMRTMVDYPSLKEDNTILRRDLEHAKMRIAELSGDFKSEQSRHEHLIKQLSERMSRPSPELQALRHELEQAREQLSHERAAVQHTEAQWKARLQEEMEANKDLRHRLAEQTSEMAALMRQLGDLKSALRQTQTALNNNIYHPNSTKICTTLYAQYTQSLLTQMALNNNIYHPDRNVGFGVDNTAHNSALADDPYLDPTLHRTARDPELLLAESSLYPPPFDESNSGEDSESQGDSIAFIEQTKARFRELEKEAEHLEQNYQDLQHRMTGVGGLYQSPLQTTPGIPVSRIPTHGTYQATEGSRHFDTEAGLNSPSSKYPRKQSGKTRSKSAKKVHQDESLVLQGAFRDHRAASPRLSDHVTQEQSRSGRRSRSSSSSSASSMVSLRASDLQGPGHKDAAMWLSPGPAKPTDGTRHTQESSTTLPQQRDRLSSTASQDQDQERRRMEDDVRRRERRGEDEERRRREEEQRRTEERRREEEWRRKEEQRQKDEEQRRKEEELRRKEEEQRRKEEETRREGNRRDGDDEERRRRMEEEEEEQRAWEEKRRKREEERRKKDQEAREREQRMLMELQKQEQVNSRTAGSGATEGLGRSDLDSSSDQTKQAQEESRMEREEEEEKKEGGEEEENGGGAGIKIDPMMQRYMMMVQQRKQQQEDAAPPPSHEPEVIPDSPSISIKSEGSISGEEMDGGIEDPASAGKASDNEDPFGDW